MVGPARLELARPYGQQIFIPATAFAAFKVCGLDYPFTITEVLGAARLVSTPSFRFQKAWLGITI